MKEMISKLVAQGIDIAIATSMVESFKPKTEKKKKGGWHPGMESSSTKIEAPVDVYTRCILCNKIEHQVVTMKIDPKSPTTQKVSCSVCKNCPEYLAQFTHAELISIILLGEKPQPELNGASVKMRANMAQKLTPKEVITYASKTPESN
jgi:hypothetical protein